MSEGIFSKNGILKGPYFKSPRPSRGITTLSLTTHEGTIVTKNKVDSQLREVFNLSFAHPIYIGDENYYLPTEEEIKQIVTASDQHRRQYYPCRFDCDDFAFVLKGEFCLHSFDDSEVQYGLCAGMMWGQFSWKDKVHAINWAMISNANSEEEIKILLIEPQNDLYFESDAYRGNMSLVLV